MEWTPRPGSDTSLLFDVFALAQRARALLDVALRDGGLRADEYAVYSVVFEREPVTQTELARHAHMPLTTVADHVRAMLRRDHVRRTANPTDQRSSLLTLRPAGRQAHKRASRAFERARQALLAELGEAGEARAREAVRALTDAAARAEERMRVRR